MGGSVQRVSIYIVGLAIGLSVAGCLSAASTTGSGGNGNGGNGATGGSDGGKGASGGCSVGNGAATTGMAGFWPLAAGLLLGFAVRRRRRA